MADPARVRRIFGPTAQPLTAVLAGRLARHLPLTVFGVNGLAWFNPDNEGEHYQIQLRYIMPIKLLQWNGGQMQVHWADDVWWGVNEAGVVASEFGPVYVFLQ